MSDTKFYPQPMSIEKRAVFIRYQKLNSKFKEEKEKYRRLFEELMNNENKVDISKGLDKIAFHLLCKRKVLEKVFLAEYNINDAQLNAMRVINVLLFAQSVIMWSYPTMYYMSGKIEKAQLFEYMVSQLEKLKDTMVEYINSPLNRKCSEFIHVKEIIEKEINDINDFADIF